jgi:hypothetical protein
MKIIDNSIKDFQENKLKTFQKIINGIINLLSIIFTVVFKIDTTFDQNGPLYSSININSIGHRTFCEATVLPRKQLSEYYSNFQFKTFQSPKH